MTEKEARDVLKLHNICLIHGCKKLEQVSNPYANVFGPKTYYCPECETEQNARIARVIAEAKAVLGLEAK